MGKARLRFAGFPRYARDPAGRHPHPSSPGRHHLFRRFGAEAALQFVRAGRRLRWQLRSERLRAGFGWADRVVRDWRALGPVVNTISAGSYYISGGKRHEILDSASLTASAVPPPCQPALERFRRLPPVRRRPSCGTACMSRRPGRRRTTSSPEASSTPSTREPWPWPAAATRKVGLPPGREPRQHPVVECSVHRRHAGRRAIRRSPCSARAAPTPGRRGSGEHPSAPSRYPRRLSTRMSPRVRSRRVRLSNRRRVRRST